MNPHCYDDKGNTPLHIAAERNLLEVVIWLVEEKGSMVTVINGFNQTPVHVARNRGHHVIADYLEGRICQLFCRRRPRVKSI
jgi:ankyrin repeat protein